MGLGYEFEWQAPLDFCLDIGSGIEQTKSKEYYQLSIMQHDSVAYAQDSGRGVADMPLVRWKNGRAEDGSKPNDENAELICEAKGISDGDQEAIKSLYSWSD